MDFDIKKIRADFPILSRSLPNGQKLTYLDNGATAQKPKLVIDRLQQFLTEENANIHRGLHHLSATATQHYEHARETIATAIDLPSDMVAVFTRGTTESINLVSHGLAAQLQAGDEIILTLMEHHANFVPWQILAEQTGVVLRFISVKDNGELDLAEWQSAFNKHTKVAAFTHVSNALGTVNPVAEMCQFARERGVLTLVDGAQAVPHGPIQVSKIGADFYVFSGHKVFGPDGIGILAGKRKLLDALRPYQGGGDMIDRVTIEGTTYREAPERFEAGTPNISAAIGLATAFDYLATIDWQQAHQHEQQLLNAATERLKSIPGLRIIGEAPGKVSVISFVMAEAHPQDIATILDQVGVAIRTGHHCAQPLMTHFGLTSTARASFAMYNNMDDVEALADGLAKVQRMFA